MWYEMKDKKPKDGALITAIGNFMGEIYGVDEYTTVGTGIYEEKTNSVILEADCYMGEIVNITHWKNIGKLPVKVGE